MENKTISKLQSEAVKELDSKFYGAILWDKMTGKKPTYIRGKIKKLITDQIQKAYSKGREEVLKEKDIAEKFLYSNLPLDLSIGTEFEVGCRYEDWGFYCKDLAILVKENKIFNGNLRQRHLRKTHSYFYIFTNSKSK